jgi:hypothetical protein
VSEERIPVFVGPSLTGERPSGPFEWRPPAAAGDLISLIEAPPDKLCLIDGYFDSRPAPWHKELLALMAQGTMVFGASSMGALRAAELHCFGMIGVGAIFRAYKEHRLHGDDEVALIHADERLDWAPLTVPMVEVRATLEAACRTRILSPRTARNIRTRVHEIHFEDRDWPLMERTCVGEGLIDQRCFRCLQGMHVQLKRADALDCLEQAVAAKRRSSSTPPPPWTCFIRALAKLP